MLPKSERDELIFKNLISFNFCCRVSRTRNSKQTLPHIEVSALICRYLAL